MYGLQWGIKFQCKITVINYLRELEYMKICVINYLGELGYMKICTLNSMQD